MNYTIDDSLPDPRTGNSIIYNPASAWNSWAVCQNEPGKCTATPNGSELEGGTWHESTFNPSDASSNNFPNTPLTATIQFEGTAVYVFCALALTTSGPSGNSDMSFKIDGETVGSFVKPAPGVPGYQYNIPVYSNLSLPAGQHELLITNGRVGGAKSLMILDRVVYTVKADPSPFPENTTSGGDNRTPPGIIVGAVLGSLCGVLLFVAAFLFGRKHRRRGRSRPVTPATPPPPSPPHTFDMETVWGVPVHEPPPGYMYNLSEHDSRAQVGFPS